MQDTVDIVQNIERVYDSNTAFQVLKDFERVIDELDVYVYDNWEDGELASGPEISRHFVTCTFMWPRNKMPDPMGGKRLLDYDCKVGYLKDYIIKPRKIRTPDDIRPGSKKGKLDKEPIWLVQIKMPKKLIADIYGGSMKMEELTTEPASETPQAGEVAPQAADMSAGMPPTDMSAGMPPAGEAAPAGEGVV
jgi:hypothetical protein